MMHRFFPFLLTAVATATFAGDVKEDARTFLEHCEASRFAEAAGAFGPKMAAALSAEKLEQVWKGVEKQLGPIAKFGDPREDRVGASRRVRIRCEFEKGPALDALVSFDPDGKIEGFFLSPAADSAPANAAKKPEPPYADPSTHEEAEVVVGAEGWPLAGTLTRPKGVEKAPLIVLVHGSGPHDRDETIGPNNPFRDLAHGLASRGVAVLRYEKRTFAHKTRLVDPKVAATIGVSEEVIDDAVATVAKARMMDRIDPARIFVLGHSLGGVAAPEIARRDGKLAGVVMLAASTRPAADLVRDQVDHVRKVDPERGKALDQAYDGLDEALARLKAGTAGDDETILGAPVRYWKTMDALHPDATLAAMPDLPALILQGGRDYQVTDVDLAAFRKALDGRPNVTVTVYPDLNHIFLKGEGKSVPSEYETPGFVDPRVIDDVAAWIKTH
jgi:dienelactone hydrolase